jgi:hypothetical protein
VIALVVSSLAFITRDASDAAALERFEEFSACAAFQDLGREKNGAYG